MSDPWQYRIRVFGPDRDRWFEKATEHMWGGDDADRDSVLFSWPMSWNWDSPHWSPRRTGSREERSDT